VSLFIIDKDTPNPKIGDTLHLRLRDLKDGDGKPYDLSTATKIYATIKDSLADADVDAAAQIDSVNESNQFILTYGSTGNMDAIFSPSDTSGLTAGTLYYIDVRAIWNTGEVVSIVRDTIIFDEPVTKSSS
jgi:hypothetical protein